MRRIASIIAALLIAWSGSALADHYGQQKVVYHFNGDGGADGNGYRAGLTNIQNQIDMVGLKNLTTKVVLHGNGLTLLKAANTNAALRDQVEHLRMQGVEFLICGITLQRRNIALKELYDAKEEDVVHSGVGELSHLQKQGYSYIKP